MEINLIAVILIVMVFMPVITKKINIISWVDIIASLIILLIICFIGVNIIQNGHLSYLNEMLYIDSLSIIQLFIISSISFICIIYSHKYIKGQIERSTIGVRRARIYYFLFSLFLSSMIFLALSNNVMGMWIGLEATTLSTAFLIGFNNSKTSLQAAWKYIIICSIGIMIGLMGIIIFIYSAGAAENTRMLNWTELLANHDALSKNFVKIAFTFIFVGIGTKVGLAPMHTWLPDSHSEAPSPVNAMMSGILKCLALYVIVRFYAIVRLTSDGQNLKYFFIVFGIISLIIASFSILRQTNFNRLLAFSSVENMGIIALGFGFGGTLGTYGALLHSLIHAYGKALLFLVTGNIIAAYNTKRMDKIQYLIKTMPVNACFLILGILVITGIPPFTSFFSEFTILMAGINNGYYLWTSIYVLCLLLVCAGFFSGFIKMIFNGENVEYMKLNKDKENVLPLVILTIFILLTGLAYGNYLSPILTKAAEIVCGI